MAGSVSLSSLAGGVAQACGQTAGILIQLSGSIGALRATLRTAAAECLSTQAVLERLQIFIKPSIQGVDATIDESHDLDCCFQALLQSLIPILDNITIESQRMRQYASEGDSLVQAKLNRLLQDLLYDARYNLRTNRSSISIMMDCAQRYVDGHVLGLQNSAVIYLSILLTIYSGILEGASLQRHRQASPASSMEKIRDSPCVQPKVVIRLTQQSRQPHIHQQKVKIRPKSVRPTKAFMSESKLAKKLHEGIQNGDHGTVVRALSSAADPNSRIKGSKLVPIHSALSQAEAALGCEDEIATRDLIMIVIALVLAGADLQAVDPDGRTPLIRATKGEMGYGLVCLMLEYGACANAVDNNGNTALHYAAMQNNLVEMGNTETIKTLVACGADLSIQNRRGRTALYEAVMWEHMEQTCQLIEYGSDLEIPDNQGWTPLYAAVFQGHARMTKILCERGALVDEKDKTGQTPLHYAISQGHHAIVELLVQTGANVNLVAKGETPLCRAVAKTNASLLEYLLKHGADASVPSPGYNGALPIHIAAIGKDLDIVAALVNAGSCIDAKDGAGRTPLAWARESGRNEVAEFLIGKGASAQSR